MNALTLYRFSRSCRGFPVLCRFIDRINTALTGCVIPATAQIGIGTRFEYGGKGVRISACSMIGNDVYIAPFVHIDGEAVIHDHAVIGPGCHLKGPITVQRYQEVHLSQLAAR